MLGWPFGNNGGVVVVNVESDNPNSPVQSLSIAVPNYPYDLSGVNNYTFVPAECTVKGVTPPLKPELAVKS